MKREDFVKVAEETLDSLLALTTLQRIRRENLPRFGASLIPE